jgi:hypothetical protein
LRTRNLDDRTKILGYEDTVFIDRVMSLNWVQNLFTFEAIQPYFKIGAGQLNREASGSYANGSSPNPQTDALTAILRVRHEGLCHAQFRDPDRSDELPHGWQHPDLQGRSRPDHRPSSTFRGPACWKRNPFGDEACLALVGAARPGGGEVGPAFWLQAAHGQLELFNKAVPISVALANPRLEPAYRRALEEIPAIKKFGEEQGLKPTHNYQEFVDLKRDAVVQVVSEGEAR